MPMGGTAQHRRYGHKGAILALAMLALLVKLAAPPGLMAAAPGSGFPLVICTGHGPLTAQGPADRGDLHKSRGDAPCAFAGHTAPPPPAPGVQIAALLGVQSRSVQAALVDLVPGRGLAAPPPPAQGPPQRL